MQSRIFRVDSQTVSGPAIFGPAPNSWRFPRAARSTNGDGTEGTVRASYCTFGTISGIYGPSWSILITRLIPSSSAGGSLPHSRYLRNRPRLDLHPSLVSSALPAFFLLLSLLLSPHAVLSLSSQQVLRWRSYERLGRSYLTNIPSKPYNFS